MTYYVTGAAGFIGSHFCELVRDRSDHLPIPIDPKLGHVDLAGRLRDAGPDDTVVLLGAYPEVDRYVREPEMDVHENVEEVVQQLRAAANAGVILVASSFGGLYAGYGTPVPVRTPPDPVSPYFAGKLAIEAYAQAQIHTGGRAAIIAARFANVYGPPGPGQLTPWRGVVADWIRRRWEEQPFDVWGDPEATRDYVHVADVCEALWNLSRPPEAYAPYPSIVHIGTGVLTDLVTLGTWIAYTDPRGGDTTPQWSYEDLRPGYVVHGSPIDRPEAQRNISTRQRPWRPRPLEAGLRETWASYVQSLVRT